MKRTRHCLIECKTKLTKEVKGQRSQPESSCEGGTNVDDGKVIWLMFSVSNIFPLISTVAWDNCGKHEGKNNEAQEVNFVKSAVVWLWYRASLFSFEVQAAVPGRRLLLWARCGGVCLERGKGHSYRAHIFYTSSYALQQLSAAEEKKHL